MFKNQFLKIRFPFFIFCIVISSITADVSIANEKGSWSCEGEQQCQITETKDSLLVNVIDVSKSTLSSYQEVKPLTGGHRFVIYFETDPEVEGREYALFAYKDQWTLRRASPPGTFNTEVGNGTVEDLQQLPDLSGRQRPESGISLKLDKNLIESDIKLCSTWYTPISKQDFHKKISPEHQEYYVQERKISDEREAKIKSIFEELKVKIQEVQDITFAMEKEISFEKYPRDGRLEEVEVQIKYPDKRKKTGKEIQPNDQFRYEHRVAEIENGLIHWNISDFKDVQKTVNLEQQNDIESPLPKFRGKEEITSIRLYWGDWKISELSLKGEEPCDGQTCYVLKAYNREFWLGKEDGILRKFISIPVGSEAKETISIHDVHINQNLDDTLSDYQPVEGAKVTETTITHQEGEQPQHSWYVPYTKPVLTEEQHKEMDGKIKEVLSRYETVKDFSCRYKHKHFIGGQSEYPPGSGKLLDSAKIEEGILKFQKPFKLNYSYQEISSPMDYSMEKFLISDGTTLWHYEQMSYAKPPAGKPKMVLKQKVTDVLGLRNKMMQAVEGWKKEAAKFVEPEPGHPGQAELTEPPSALANFMVGLPTYVIEPLKVADPTRLIYEGEENVNGEKTYVFSVKESGKTRKAKHWIGAIDGIPRKIVEYNFRGEKVEVDLELTNVKTNNGFMDQDFQFVDHDEYTTKAWSEVVPKETEEQLDKAFNMPPEDIFKNYFNTPVGEVAELKGAGMAFIGYELYIRFKSTGDVIVKDKEKFVPVNLEAIAENEDFLVKEALEFFKKVFSEDKQYLETKEDLTLLHYSIGFEQRWLLINKKHGIYFLHVAGNQG